MQGASLLLLHGPPPHSCSRRLRRDLQAACSNGESVYVDNEVTTLKLLGMAREREGYRIAAAQDGSRALAHLEAEVPALMILDVMLPGVSGSR